MLQLWFLLSETGQIRLLTSYSHLGDNMWKAWLSVGSFLHSHHFPLSSCDLTSPPRSPCLAAYSIYSEFLHMLISHPFPLDITLFHIISNTLGLPSSVTSLLESVILSNGDESSDLSLGGKTVWKFYVLVYSCIHQVQIVISIWWLLEVIY